MHFGAWHRIRGRSGGVLGNGAEMVLKPLKYTRARHFDKSLFVVSKPGRAVEGSAGWEMAVGTFWGVPRCILVCGTGYGEFWWGAG